MAFRTVFTLMLLLATGFAAADTLLIEENISSGQATNHPTRGMTMATVESRYGPPVTRRAAVGDPPITRWEYPDYIVFFEYNHVIHAVVPQRVAQR